MKSNKENIHGLLGWLKDAMHATKTKLSSKEFPILRLLRFNFGKQISKTKQLKEKYSLNYKRENYYRRNRQVKPVIENNANKTSAVKSSLLTLIYSLGSKVKLNPKFENYNLRKYIDIRTVLVVTAAVLVVGFTLRAASGVEAYAVEVNGKKVATVIQKADAEKIVQELKGEKSQSLKRRVDVSQSLAFRKVKARRYQVNNLVALKQRLNKSLNFVAVATGIKVNGQVAVVVENVSTAEEILKELKTDLDIDDVKVDSVNLEEKIEIVDVPASLKEILKEDEAINFLRNGREEKRVHIVKEGDSLWTIARANDMRVAELLEMNPSLTEHLDLGQEINLVSVKPLINVVVTGERTVKQALPYKVVVETDRNMSRGREKVKVQGEKGLKETTYKLVMKNGDVINQQVINEKVIKTAKNQVVVRGKKEMIASRGTVSTFSSGGKVSWPLRGRITSSYGRRWGETHTGIDIDGVTGQPVGSAADGVVIQAGRVGGYGKMILVRHGNGLTTRYAHLSSIGVSVGDKISRGEVIGRVGSTGRSTGSHLHFEVIDGGRIQNPMKYLR